MNQGLPATANLRNREGAIESFDKAGMILKPLASVENVGIETIVGYVEAMNNLVNVLVVMDRREEAQAIAGDAIRTAELLRARYPDDDEARGIVARSNFRAAIAHGYPDSLPFWKVTESIYETLLASQSDNPLHQRNAALAQKYLGSYYYYGADPAKASEHYSKAVTLDEKRLRNAPGDPKVLFDVAIDLSNIGSVHMEQGDFATAAAFFERSLAHRQTLAAGDPENILATSRLAYMHSGLGHVHEKLNDFTQDQIPCMSGLGWQGVATCRPP